jgi:CrcB protein
MMSLAAKIAVVALGGALGALGRTGGTALVASVSGLTDTGRVLGTLVVNLAGCFGLGVVKAASEVHHWGSAELNAFLISGVLGAFTTFSTFEENSVRLWRDGQEWLAAGYMGGSVAGGLLMFLLGWALIDA